MRYILIIVLVVATFSCSSSSAPVAAGTETHFQTLGPVITRIVNRGSTLIVRSGTVGPTYSLESPAGIVLVPDMTLDELAMKNQDLFKRVKAMQVTMLWAGAD